MKTYQQKKESARMEAVEWQADFANHNYSYGELAAWHDYFEKLGRRFGLLKEFRENGFICIFERKENIEVTMEDILKKYFGCRKPFLEKPIFGHDYYRRFLTREGERAYGELISLLYDLEKITGMPIPYDLVETLDNIADGFVPEKQR